ncbi:MAG: F0F1 ATP synthase subunit delta [Candidatus Saccharimonadales bacterium]
MARRLVAHHIAHRIADGSLSIPSAMQQLAAYLIVHRETKQTARYVADIERELGAAGLVVADVVTARPIDAALRQAIRALLGAPDAVLRESIDPSLIGGVIVRAGGRELDGSVRTKLQRLRST